MDGYQKKFDTLAEAIADARDASEKYLDFDLHVIEDHREKKFYVDDSGFIRGFETLHEIFRAGKKVKQ